MENQATCNALPGPVSGCLSLILVRKVADKLYSSMETNMSKNVQILVVDDDDFLREAIVEILEPHFSVKSAQSGKAALEVVKANSIDIVLSDVSMPNGTGIELLAWIREMNPSSPVVVLVTGYSTMTPEEAIKRGAYAVIPKPFGSRVLLDAVNKIVSDHQLASKHSA